MKFLRRNQAEEPVFQLAPMIDVIFLLLIFFVTTSLLGEIEAQIQVSLPVAKNVEAPGSPPRQLVVNVKLDDTMWINNREVKTLDELQAILHSVVEADPGVAVIIRGDTASTHGRVIHIMDRARAEGIRDIRFPVLKEEPPGGEAAP